MTLANEAEALLAELIAVYPLKSEPKIVWRKMPVSAGKAYFERNLIVLSKVLITDRLRLQDTLVHEFAHLLAYARHGRRGIGHGQPWKDAMRDLGARPDVYHEYPVERRRQTRSLVFRCEKCGEAFTRARPLKAGYRYMHRGCGGQIKSGPHGKGEEGRSAS